MRARRSRDSAACPPLLPLPPCYSPMAGPCPRQGVAPKGGGGVRGASRRLASPALPDARAPKSEIAAFGCQFCALADLPMGRLRTPDWPKQSEAIERVAL